jgi:uncharacterized protein (DUF2147 family)
VVGRARKNAASDRRYGIAQIQFNAALQRRPIIGLTLFSGMRPAGASRWSGQIYNADDGKTYASTISVTGPTTLRVEGCVGTLCGGEDWSRTTR